MCFRGASSLYYCVSTQVFFWLTFWERKSILLVNFLGEKKFFAGLFESEKNSWSTFWEWNFFAGWVFEREKKYFAGRLFEREKKFAKLSHFASPARLCSQLNSESEKKGESCLVWEGNLGKVDQSAARCRLSPHRAQKNWLVWTQKNAKKGKARKKKIWVKLTNQPPDAVCHHTERKKVAKCKGKKYKKSVRCRVLQSTKSELQFICW